MSWARPPLPLPLSRSCAPVGGEGNSARFGRLCLGPRQTCLLCCVQGLFENPRGGLVVRTAAAWRGRPARGRNQDAYIGRPASGYAARQRVFFAVEPEQVVEESLSAIENGPVHWIGGSEQTARAIEGMGRAAAVSAVSRAFQEAVP